MVGKDGTVSLAERRSSFSQCSTIDLDSSIIHIDESNLSAEWKLPSLLPKEIYKLKLWEYVAAQHFRVSSVDIAFTDADNPVHINLLDRSQIDWAQKQGYKYVHLGAIRLGLNPLVRPFLNVSSLCVAVDTRHKHFSNAIIGGLATPLHAGPAFGTIYPKFSVSLFDPHIYELLKAYVLPQGFSMMDGSRIIQLKAAVIVRFGNDTLPPLQFPVHNTPRPLSVVEKDISRKAQPVLFDWRGIQYPQEWECKYDEL